MAAHLKTEQQTVSRLAERQMRNWELARSQRATSDAGRAIQVEQFLSISRSVGLPGVDVAENVSQRLGWPVFDKEVLHLMAGDDEFRRRIYASMDERDLTWLEACLRPLGLPGVERDDYFHRLTETVCALARTAPVIFLGRATDLILPRNVGLRIWLTANHDYCIERFAALHDLTRKSASQAVAEIEKDRARFIRHHFHIDAGDPTRHDLVFNMQYITVPEVVDIILAALRVRGALP